MLPRIYDVQTVNGDIRFCAGCDNFGLATDQRTSRYTTIQKGSRGDKYSRVNSFR